jgi:uncharacterized protein YPO0396
MFSRKAKLSTTDGEESAAAVDAAAGIVAKTRRSADFQFAQAQLDGLRRRATELQTEIQELIASKANIAVAEHARAIDRQVEDLVCEQAELGPKIHPAFSAVVRARGGYDEQITTALAPLRHEAMAAALKAISDLREALALYDSCNGAARRVGSPEMHRPGGIMGAIDELARAFKPKIGA